VTVPPSRGITSAGQHHIPIKAGMETISVNMAMQTLRRSACVPSSSLSPGGSNRSLSSDGSLSHSSHTFELRCFLSRSDLGT
jgi:hypothetical protein